MLDLAILGLLEERRPPWLRDPPAPARPPGASGQRLVRLAVPGAGPPRGGRARSRRSRTPGPRAAAVPLTGSLSGERAALRARRHARGPGPAEPQGLPHHRRRAGPVHRAARGRPGQRRRPQLRAAPSLRPPPAPQARLRPARAPAGPAGPAPGRGRAAAGQADARRLRPLGRRAHRRRHRAGHLLARPADRGRTGALRGEAPRSQALYQDRSSAAERAGHGRRRQNDEHRPGRDRRRGQLRQLARPGRLVLPRRRARRRRPRPDARGAWGLPRARPRVRRRLRRRRGQGGHRPGQGHLRRPEQHHPLRRGGRAGRHRPAGPDLRRAGHATTARSSRSPRPPRSTWPRRCARPGPTCW